MTTTVPCYMPYLGDPRRPCVLPIDHDGPHVTRNGRGWHDSDDMDGGVTAALIEKEAEPDEGAHIGPEGEVDWHGLYLSENRRAEKAERERDGALRLAKTAADQADEALGMVARGECHDCIRDAAVIREPHPLTPDAITDEMVERAAHCLAMGQMPSTYSRNPDGTAGKFYDDAREVLCAAFTEPPARPEGAEEIECELTGVGPLELDNPLSAREQSALADFLAERGVRVVTEDGGA